VKAKLVSENVEHRGWIDLPHVQLAVDFEAELVHDVPGTIV